MGKEIAAIAFSDLHVNLWNQFNEKNRRLTSTLRVIVELGSLAKKHNVPLLFSGDFFHNPKALPNPVINRTLKIMKEYIEDKGVKIYAISGNHDQSESNTLKSLSPAYGQGLASAFKNFQLIDYVWKDEILNGQKARIFGIPYLKGNEGFKITLKRFRKNLIKDGLNILLIHTDLPEAIDTDGRVVGTSESIPGNLKKFFRGFNLVLCGHIHKPQIILKGKNVNVLMIGSPTHQVRDDAGCEMGYWNIYTDGSYKFIPLDYPQFKYLKDGEEAPDEKHYYISSKPKDSTLGVPTNESSRFHKTESRERIAKAYCKVKKVEDKTRIKTLVRILKKTEDD